MMRQNDKRAIWRKKEKSEMAKKRTYREQFQAGEPVPTQELAAEYVKPAGVDYVAAVDFDFLGVSYKAGEPFAPVGLVPDKSFDEFRAKNKNGGVAFMDADGRRHVLPVR